MVDIWQPEEGILVREVNGSMFFFQFYHSSDLKKVLEGGPWTYDNHLFILHKMKPGDSPTEVPLFYTNFWVQVYDVPAEYMSEAFVNSLESSLEGFWNMCLG